MNDYELIAIIGLVALVVVVFASNILRDRIMADCEVQCGKLNTKADGYQLKDWSQVNCHCHNQSFFNYTPIQFLNYNETN